MAKEQQDNQPKRSPAAHLVKHQFKPGHSGNPKGRPKGRIDLSGRIRKELLRRIKGDQEMADAVAKSVVASILKDPVKASKLLLSIQDRDEGPVVQSPLVEINAGGAGRTTELPPIKPSERGGMSLKQHLDTLVRVAQERGVGEIIDAEVEILTDIEEQGLEDLLS
ncbi:MAG: hypothetical protein GY884_05660 [Proteobacteria bacterium]|nr:hypothetical protein [Pseudomonadota bacterium]